MLAAEAFLALIMKVAILPIVAFFWWTKKRDKVTLDNHTVRIVKIEENLVPEERVREIIKHEVTPLLSSINELKGLIQATTVTTQQLMLELAEDRGFRRALGTDRSS